eukprot:2492312-Amphidinium_carterae.1
MKRQTPIFYAAGMRQHHERAILNRAGAYQELSCSLELPVTPLQGGAVVECLVANFKSLEFDADFKTRGSTFLPFAGPLPCLTKFQFEQLVFEIIPRRQASLQELAPPHEFFCLSSSSS